MDPNKAVRSIFVEKQQRLLTAPLYCSWKGPGPGRTFLATSNVGLFFEPAIPPLAPDAMLSVDVKLGDDLSRRENRSYFVWLRGKVPDVVIEIVSDRRGGEETHKMQSYARYRVLYYVIFDPVEYLDHGVLRAFRLQDGTYQPMSPDWFPAVGLGLKLWEGEFEGEKGRWLRWCDQQGQVIPTGREQTARERQRADEERQRAERLEARLRALGVDPTSGEATGG
jgi:hypothetical protein